MNQYRKIMLILLFASSGWYHANAHSDPLGDIHPKVVVEDENFSIYFTNNSVDGRFNEATFFRIVYSVDGKLIAPRHRVSQIPELSLVKIVPEFEVGDAEIDISGGQTQIQPLRWPVGEKIGLVWNAGISPEHIAVGVKKQGETEYDIFDDYLLYLFPREGYRYPKPFLIGAPETIYMFPTSSNIVFAEGRFWIVWVRGLEMVLSAIHPHQDEPTEQILRMPGNWNSAISIATIGDRLCVACHRSKRHEYPGESTIQVEFVTLD